MSNLRRFRGRVSNMRYMLGNVDICRVCRSEATNEKPLYHPCICTGSIKFIHQDCLLQWLKYSRKEYCELCNHRFSFMPIYAPDMPNRLPIKDIFSGLLRSLMTAVRFWVHYTLVAFAWLGIVPLTACRIYRCLFTGSLSSILTLPFDMVSSENLLSDSLYGCCVVTCTLCAFISLVWLREQILHGGGPEWLEQEHDLIHNILDNPIEFVNNLQANPPPPRDVPELVDEEEPDAGNDGNNGAQADVNNWNPIEWDHAAEELTWERLLGLDGSLVFMEHVFWVVSLNTLFIVVFAFCPYHIGQFSLAFFGLKEYIKAPEFEGLLTTLFGYVNVGAVLAVLHGIAALIRLHKTRRLLGICYVVIKVSLLSVIEIGIFPLVCGWWLDICSLTMLDATIHDREAGFKLAPGTSMFIHWLAGMVYVFYFASFILLLREVLRPGVLWFLRNLNDPDFNPIQEMIHSPILRHIRRVVVSLITFGTTILLVVWLPVQIIEKIAPGFLPYYVMLSGEMPYSELSLELVLLQIVLPGLLEQGHMRTWLKLVVQAWCIGVSYILDIRSYLLGDVNLGDEQSSGEAAPVPPPPADAEGEERFQQNAALAAAHQALFQPISPSSFQPYKKPRFLPFKIVCLILCICVSLTLGSLIMITVPAFVGRKIMSLWLGNTRVHELYTIGCGMYVWWIVLRICTLLWSWIPKGWSTISAKLTEWITIGVKMICSMSVLLGVIPVLMGLMLDLIITVPARVSLNQTPLISVWQDWAIGVLLTKTICAVALVGPNWWMKRTIEQVYLGGIRNINLKLIFMDLAVPVIIFLGLSLSIPYIISWSIVPLFTTSFELQNAIYRRIYPAMLTLFIISMVISFQIRQFFRLYEHIKNDKYLVGKRLVNYDHRKVEKAETEEETVTS